MNDSFFGYFQGYLAISPRLGLFVVTWHCRACMTYQRGRIGCFWNDHEKSVAIDGTGSLLRKRQAIRGFVRNDRVTSGETVTLPFQKDMLLHYGAQNFRERTDAAGY